MGLEFQCNTDTGIHMKSLTASLVALFSSLVIMMLACSLTSILLPVRAEMEAFSAIDIGLMGAFNSAGFVIGCLTAPLLIRRIGLIKSFALLAVLSGALTFFYPLLITPLAWIALRFLTGIGSAGLFSVIESWLKESAHNNNRGMIFSLYMMINLICQTSGRFGIMLDNPHNSMLFIAAAIIMGCAFLPICFVKAPTVNQAATKRFKIMELSRLAPVGVIGNLCFGLCGGAFSTMAPIYAQNNGMSLAGIAMFASAATIGGAISQYPLGKLSDRIDRRLIISILCLIGSPLSLLLVLGDRHISTMMFGASLVGPQYSQIVLCLIALLHGAMFHPIYSLAVSHANDHVPSHRYVEASSTNLLIWGIGASIGPFVSAYMIQSLGSGGLFLFISAVLLSVGISSFYYFYRRHPFTSRMITRKSTHSAFAEGSCLTPEKAAASPQTLA